MTTTTPQLERVSLATGRHYVLPGTGEVVPSVTTVLGMINKPFLAGWQTNEALKALVEAAEGRQKAGQVISPDFLRASIKDAKGAAYRKRDAAADFGSQSHDLIERRIKSGGPLPDWPPHLTPVLHGFEDWLKRSQFRFEWAERGVYSAKYGYAGTVDCMAWHGEELVITDWKTSSRLSWEYALQVAAYAKAWEEMTGQSVKQAWVIRLGKAQPEFEARQVKDMETAFIAFRAALYLFKAHGKELLGS